MIDKLLAELITEVKKIRNDLDAVKAYQLTIAESLQQIAVNTAPADDTTPDDNTSPAGNEET